MSEQGSRRGYQESDEREFVHQIDILKKAAKDVSYLLEAGYPVKNATTFVGNHYLLSERQRLALARSVSRRDQVEARKKKELAFSDLLGQVANIDGFNTVISLEIAFSKGTLLRCMDGTIRDLAGLRGSYRLIDKTDPAVWTIREVLESCGAAGAVFYLDAPVSNSGRLKQKIQEVFSGSSLFLDVQVINDVDRVLMRSDCVVTSDAVILDHCSGWFNLVKAGIKMKLGKYPFVQCCS